MNLTIRNSETHVLVGPNACGKTSLAFTILDYPQYKIERVK